MYTGLSPAARSLASRAASTARVFISLTISPKPDASSAGRTVLKVLVVMMSAPRPDVTLVHLPHRCRVRVVSGAAPRGRVHGHTHSLELRSDGPVQDDHFTLVHAALQILIVGHDLALRYSAAL